MSTSLVSCASTDCARRSIRNGPQLMITGIINNPAIPNEKNDEAVATASGSILDGLKNAVSGGDLGALTSMFNSGGDAASNSAVSQNIQSGFIQNLMHKFGLDQGKAASIAGALIPVVMQKLVHKTNDPNDGSFDFGGIIGSLTGGGGIMDKLKGMFS